MIPGGLSKTTTASRTADFKWEFDTGVSGMRLIRWGKKERKRKSNEQKEVKTISYNLTFLTLRRLMSYIYIYGAPILDVSRSHTTTQHSR